MNEVEQTMIPDFDARKRALRTSESYIVQAPAGSGKTELLAQRYLGLLAEVDAPEEIIAVTFTRKAQGEMLDRIISALDDAQGDICAYEPHRLATLQRARAALRRNEVCRWRLLDQPARLRIMTIDALSGAITSRMPYLSRSGGALTIAQYPDELYAQAAAQTLQSLGAGEPTTTALEKLVSHLDNRVDRVERLLAAMLRQRDRWLRLVVPEGAGRDARARLEKGMQALVEDVLGNLATMIPAGCQQELTVLASLAARNLSRAGSSSPIRCCEGLTALPCGQHDALDEWRGIAELLLTGEGGWRKRVDKRQGFPKGTKALKQRLMALIGRLAGREALRARLHAAVQMPDPRYTEHQWSILSALLEVLPLAVAHLTLIFQERAAVDYTSVASRALQALGELDAPTDLALQLDYSIRHILVDEFQDTSYSQYELLERLTAGWQPGDGRTLFCVGDPMQSIYRFREADVGLFLQARRGGLRNVNLQPLRLTMNFRSQRGIVDWVNAGFPALLPSREDVATGAVPYSAFHPHHPALPGKAVTFHPQLHRDGVEEARRVVASIREARREHPDGSVGVLVSARAHLAAILPELKRAGVVFQAIEIERLLNRPLIQDLMALTRSLTHLADRTAWLALLRAPWCGLLIGDLFALCSGERRQTTWEQINDSDRRARLTPDGQARLGRIQPILEAALKARGRGTLRRRVEGAWLALGGPATLQFTSDLADAMAYLDLLETLEKGGELFEPAELEQRLAELYAIPDAVAPDAVQVMTIHKAKGLQFDTVILPGLGRSPRHREKSLLHWMKTVRASRGHDVILAPIHATGEESDRWHEYLHKLEQEREALERGRLLYVAATRARRYLHLLGHTTIDESLDPPVLKKPAKGSLLSLLWPSAKAHFEDALADRLPGQCKPARTPAQKGDGIRRLPLHWKLPLAYDALEVTSRGAERTATAPIKFDWVGETARQVGMIVHRELQRIADDGLSAWPARRVEERRGFYAAFIEASGLPESERPVAADRVCEAVVNALDDRKGRWILACHDEAENELALTGTSEEKGLVSIVIDRTFVDEDGRRWIIDYKTSVHTGAGRDQFLDNEAERYGPQLQLYGTLLSKRSGEPVHLGLYFPLLKAWREVGVVEPQS